jgi:hypothetical protein
MTGGDGASSKKRMPDLSRDDALDYVASMLHSMGKIAENCDLPALSHLLKLAEFEARKNS